MLSPTRQTFTLLAGFTYREFSFRFAGSALGVVWALLGPLLLLGIYSFVFGQLFQQRTSLGTESYTLFVAIALWPWMMFADGVLRGMAAIQGNAGLVKKVAFPHALLVAAAVLAAFAQHLLGYAVVLLLLAANGAPIVLAGLPLALCYLFALLLLTFAAALLFAALQTLLKDVEQIVSPGIMMLHYLTPVLYPLTMIPLAYRDALLWNPLALIVVRLRENLLSGYGFQSSDFLYLLAILAFLYVAWAVFRRLSPFFEDFL